ncbi:hypothetical protein HKCCE2091_21925 [Rhodobacterales bacterium HKCCE2091]|nr:hypothetical protein [Rhodobacterales bacterium HKCCE2091]
MAELPEIYFRIRDNGAAVFRVEAETRHKRLEMTEIAAVNVKNGSVKPHGGAEIAPVEAAAIDRWLDARRAELQARDDDQPNRCIETLNLTAQWAQARAEPEALEAATDALLLAMHDLRSLLVRKRANRAGRPEGDDETG